MKIQEKILELLRKRKFSCCLAKRCTTSDWCANADTTTKGRPAFPQPLTDWNVCFDNKRISCWPLMIRILGYMRHGSAQTAVTHTPNLASSEIGIVSKER